MKEKIRILFLQSQINTWSITDVHSSLMRYYNHEHVEVHVACATGAKGEKTPVYRMLETIPDLHIRPTNFGPTIFQGSKLDTARGLLFTGLTAPVTIIELIGYIRQQHIDIVHAAEIPRDALCSTLLARLTGIKSVIHLHSRCGSWMRPSVLRALRRADGIIGVAPFVADSAIAAGCRSDRVYHAHNGLDISQWNCDTDGSTVRREFGISPDVPLFTIIGRVLPWKGHELLLKALSEIKSKIPDFRLLIVGEDVPSALPKGSGSYVAFLKERTRELGLSNHVIFTGLRSDIQQILAACDLFTMPNYEEGWGLAHLEAMAMKKAIIALDSRERREVLEHGKSGLLSPAEDSQQLAENILTLVNDPAMRKQMGEYGRKRVEDFFNAQRMADDVERIYQLVLGKTVMSRQEQVPIVEASHHR